MSAAAALVLAVLAASAAAALALLAERLLRRRGAALRHDLLAAGLVLALAIPLAVAAAQAGLALPMPRPAAAPAAAPGPATATIDWTLRDPPAGGAQVLRVSASSPASTSLPAPVSPWPGRLLRALAGVWIAGSLLAALLLACRLHRVRRLRRRAIASPRAELGTLAGELAAACAPAAPPLVHESSEVAMPCLLGWRSPRIVLPPGFLAATEAEAARAALLHECAHARRGDAWWALAGEIARALWWWHPLAQRLVARLAAVREEACDAWALRGSAARSYARLLVDLATRPARAGVLAAAPTMADLESRIRNLVSGDAMIRSPRVLVATLAVLAAGSALVLNGLAAGEAPPPPTPAPAAAAGDDALIEQIATRLGIPREDGSGTPLWKRVADAARVPAASKAELVRGLTTEIGSTGRSAAEPKPAQPQPAGGDAASMRLMTEAAQAFEAGAYGRAETLARQAYEADRRNEQARRLYLMARATQAARASFPGAAAAPAPRDDEAARIATLQREVEALRLAVEADGASKREEYSLNAARIGQLEHLLRETRAEAERARAAAAAAGQRAEHLAQRNRELANIAEVARAVAFQLNVKLAETEDERARLVAGASAPVAAPPAVAPAAQGTAPFAAGLAALAPPPVANPARDEQAAAARRARAMPHYLAARDHLEAGRYDEAIAAAKAAMSEDPEFFEANTLRYAAIKRRPPFATATPAPEPPVGVAERAGGDRGGLATAPAPSAEERARARRHLEAAQAAYKAGRYAQAQANAKTALTLDPDLKEARLSNYGVEE